MSRISTEEKLSFKRNGFLAVPDVVESSLAEEISSAIWEGIDADRADPATIIGEGYHLDVYAAVDRPDLFGRVNDAIFPLAEELVGEGVLDPPGDRVQIALKFPDEEQVLSGTALPDHGHIDGYGPGFARNGRVHGFTIGVAVYYEDVDPRSGGFTVWPGSHWKVAEYYSSHVLETPGHAHHDSVPTDLGDAHEITGTAGTAIFWHNKLVHTGGVNRGRNVRLASISRFRRSDFSEIQRDAADKLWKYWPAMEGITPDLVYPEVVQFMRDTYDDDEDEDRGNDEKEAETDDENEITEE